MITLHSWFNMFSPKLSAICKVILLVWNTDLQKIDGNMCSFITVISDIGYKKEHYFSTSVWSQRLNTDTGSEIESKLRVIHFTLLFLKTAASKNKAFSCSNYILSVYIIIYLPVYFCFQNHLGIANCSCNYLIFCLTGTVFLKLWGWSHWGDFNLFMGIWKSTQRRGFIFLCSLIIFTDWESKSI